MAACTIAIVKSKSRLRALLGAGVGSVGQRSAALRQLSKLFQRFPKSWWTHLSQLSVTHVLIIKRKFPEVMICAAQEKRLMVSCFSPHADCLSIQKNFTRWCKFSNAKRQWRHCPGGGRRRRHHEGGVATCVLLSQSRDTA